MAHDAAYRECLPEGFNQWGLRDEIGRTVAHDAARYGHLPKGFKQWFLSFTDIEGWTVAHEAAHYHHLPYNFDKLGYGDFMINSDKTLMEMLKLETDMSFYYPFIK